jgi:hypothetical protein
MIALRGRWFKRSLDPEKLCGQICRVLDEELGAPETDPMKPGYRHGSISSRSSSSAAGADGVGAAAGCPATKAGRAPSGRNVETKPLHFHRV